VKQFNVRIRDNAFNDLQDTIDYYNSKQHGLGKHFYILFEHALEILKINPYFQIRFDSIRSLPLRKFPYSIYFDVDQKNNIVNIYASCIQDMKKSEKI
jgi:hypothetical protein